MHKSAKRNGVWDPLIESLKESLNNKNWMVKSIFSILRFLLYFFHSFYPEGWDGQISNLILLETMRVRLYISCFIVEVEKKFQITIANCVFCFTPNTGQETSNLFLSSLVQNFRQSEIVEPGIDLILMSLEWIISVH